MNPMENDQQIKVALIEAMQRGDNELAYKLLAKYRLCCSSDPDLPTLERVLGKLVSASDETGVLQRDPAEMLEAHVYSLASRGSVVDAVREIGKALQERSDVALLQAGKLGLLRADARDGLRQIEAQMLSHLPTRRFIPPSFGIPGFFDRLNQEGVQYAILRWFETLPQLDEGEDIDILVADEHAVELTKYLLCLPVEGAIPCDIYSVSGGSGTSYRGLPYFPPKGAMEVLEHRRLYKGQYFVPDQYHHDLTMLFHVLFHKGERSGVRITSSHPAGASSDHDYPAIVDDIFARNAISADRSLEGIAEYMTDNGWNPGLDLGRKFALTSEFLRTLYPPPRFEDIQDGELMVFVVREWAVQWGILEKIVDFFESEGLDILEVVNLEGEARERLTRHVRGGNWGKGPWPVSGGPPAALIAALDHHPIRIDEPAIRKKYPYVVNKRLFLKHEVRNTINKRLAERHRVNPIHSGDDEREARDYLGHCSAELLYEVDKRVSERKARYRTPGFIRQVHTGRRGKVDLVDFEGRKCIRKTFKPGRERYLDREIRAYGQLSRECDLIPALIDRGENFIILPQIDGLSVHSFEKRRLLASNLHKIRDFFGFLFERGLAHLDLGPQNFLVTPANELFVIDFEFMQEYDEQPASIHESWDVAGTPADFSGDLPFRNSDYARNIDFFNFLWTTAVGMTPAEIVSLGPSDVARIQAAA